MVEVTPLERITAYRAGDSWALEAPAGMTESPIDVELVPGVRLARSGRGHLLVYKEHVPYGQPLAGALALGWARVVAASGTDERTAAG